MSEPAPGEPAPGEPRRRNGALSTIAAAVVEAFKANPSLIAIILLNIIVLGLLFRAVEKSMEAHDKRYLALLEHCYAKVP